MTTMTAMIAAFDPTYWRTLTPDGARREARSQNERVKKEREANERAHAARMAGLERQARLARAPEARKRAPAAARPRSVAERVAAWGRRRAEIERPMWERSRELRARQLARQQRTAQTVSGEAVTPNGDDPHGWKRSLRRVSTRNAWTESERSTIDTVKRALEKSLEDDEEETTSSEPETAAAAAWKRAFKNARIGGPL